MKAKLYLYPHIDPSTLKSPNPYIDNLRSSLEGFFEITNKKPANNGLLDQIKHFRKTDAYWYNWIEYLPGQKFGKPQTFLFILFVLFSKLVGKKIIWTLHNKYVHNKQGHNEKQRFWKKAIFRFMIKQSDFILTHSNAGVEFIKSSYPGYEDKVKYIIHPTNEAFAYKRSEPKYDILLWGTIHAYKGVLEFLEFVNSDSYMSQLKIGIYGYCQDPQLKDQLDRLCSNNVHYHNVFTSLDEIAQLAAKSRHILFTYNSDSVLSSGSLMDSICMNTMILGPDRGAFRDLRECGFIETYNKLGDLPDILKRSSEKNTPSEETARFCKDNNWSAFTQNISQDLKLLFN